MDFREKDGAVSFDVHVVPRSSKSEIVGVLDGALKIKLTSPPVEGAANDELIRLLSKQFDVPRANIEILSGRSGRTKRLRITGKDLAKILEALAK